MSRFELMRDLLKKGRYFKLVCGAGNEDVIEVRRLALIYTLAGANAFDVSATPEVVKSCMEGIDLAIKYSNAMKKDINVRPFITVSVGMPGDHHVRKAFIVDDCVDCGKCIPVCPTDAIPDTYEIIQEKCIGCGNCEAVCPPKVAAVRYKHNAKGLEEILPLCLAEGAENIELHAAVPDDESILEEWRVVSAAQPYNFVSMCLDRAHLSNSHLIERIRAAYEISGART
jgi:ferredoxin